MDTVAEVVRVISAVVEVLDEVAVVMREGAWEVVNRVKVVMIVGADGVIVDVEGGVISVGAKKPAVEMNARAVIQEVVVRGEAGVLM